MIPFIYDYHFDYYYRILEKLIHHHKSLICHTYTNLTPISVIVGVAIVFTNLRGLSVRIIAHFG